MVEILENTTVIFEICDSKNSVFILYYCCWNIIFPLKNCMESSRPQAGHLSLKVVATNNYILTYLHLYILFHSHSQKIQTFTSFLCRPSPHKTLSHGKVLEATPISLKWKMMTMRRIFPTMKRPVKMLAFPGEIILIMYFIEKVCRICTICENYLTWLAF